jgi:hypothetical protein
MKVYVPFLRVHDVICAQFLKIQVTGFCEPAVPEYSLIRGQVPYILRLNGRARRDLLLSLENTTKNAASVETFLSLVPRGDAM